MREVTYRQVQEAVPAINCLQEAEGAFSHLDDVTQFRVARLAQECAALLRQFEALVGPRRMEYALRSPANGKPKGDLLHPAGPDGKPNFAAIVIDPERAVEYEAAMQALLNETVRIDVREIRASQLRRETKLDGRIVTKVPAGYWTEPGAGPDGSDRVRRLAPSAILAGLAPFVTMDLGDEPD